MRPALAELRERLAVGGRDVVIALTEGGADEARVDLPPPVTDHLDLRG
jgi:hypothetical protein